MLSDSILLSIVASAVGVLSLLIRFCYISKCTNVSLCCGLLTVRRETTAENDNVNNIKNIMNVENNV